MKKSMIFITLFVTTAIFFTACGNQPVAGNSNRGDTAQTATDSLALPDFAYPVYMSHWKMGDPQNTKLILDMYRAWDNKDAAAVAGYYADSANLDLPEATRVTLHKNQVFERFSRIRNMYDSTYNRIISAYALHNNDLDEDWVMVMTYNKWSYKDGKRDSMLYLDNWRLKDGKINYLNSLQQQPARQLLKQLQNGTK